MGEEVRIVRERVEGGRDWEVSMSRKERRSRGVESGCVPQEEVSRVIVRMRRLGGAVMRLLVRTKCWMEWEVSL